MAEDLLLSAVWLTWRRPGGPGSLREAPGGAVLGQCGEEGGPPTRDGALTDLGTPCPAFPHVLE